MASPAPSVRSRVRSTHVQFPGADGSLLSGRLDSPRGKARGHALFAHCFSCSKDIFAASRVSARLAAQGIAVLRFDFTGLGASEGDFANTNFSSNVADLRAAIAWMRSEGMTPDILVGHSLGGAAVLVAAASCPEARAVVTLAAPADAEHVLHNFAADVSRIETDGEAEVKLVGRAFRIRKQFIEDARAQNVRDAVGNLRKALLVMHAPLDATVGIENASAIFAAAKHPKSYVSLDGADHLLTRRADAVYAADVIAAWASRYALSPAQMPPAPSALPHGVRVAETGAGAYENAVAFTQLDTLAGEPEALGGIDTGPSPFEFVAAGLGACTTMTLRMYAARKGWEIGPLSVEVGHAAVAAGEGTRPHRFTRVLHLPEGLSEEQRTRLLEIADKCPVHRLLEPGAEIETSVA
jgi:putative redox protein